MLELRSLQKHGSGVPRDPSENTVHTCVLRHFSLVRLFVTLWTVARQAPLSMGIFQARILEWVAMPSSRGSSRPRD